jgi:hypothetical protein
MQMKIKKEHRWKVKLGADGEHHLCAPKPNMKVGNARGWAAAMLNLPVDAVWFMNRDGSTTRADKALGKLRNEWFN